MNAYTLGIHEVGHAQIALVGGKGAGLGELSRIPGIHVPAGFCVTTAAYREVIGDNEQVGSLLDQLSACSRETGTYRLRRRSRPSRPGDTG